MILNSHGKTLLTPNRNPTYNRWYPCINYWLKSPNMGLVFHVGGPTPQNFYETQHRQAIGPTVSTVAKRPFFVHKNADGFFQKPFPTSRFDPGSLSKPGGDDCIRRSHPPSPRPRGRGTKGKSWAWSWANTSALGVVESQEIRKKIPNQLVVEPPTFEKNALLASFPPNFEIKIKYIWNHHPFNVHLKINILYGRW